MNKKTTPSPVPMRPHPMAVWLTGGCCWFTALCLFLLLLNATVWQTNGVPPLRYLLLFPLGLCASAAGMVRASACPRSVRYTLHPVLVVGGIYLFALLPYQISSDAPAATVLIMVFLILALYGAAVGIAALILRKKATAAVEKQDYQSQFGRRS